MDMGLIISDNKRRVEVKSGENLYLSQLVISYKNIQSKRGRSIKYIQKMRQIQVPIR